MVFCHCRPTWEVSIKIIRLAVTRHGVFVLGDVDTDVGVAHFCVSVLGGVDKTPEKSFFSPLFVSVVFFAWVVDYTCLIGDRWTEIQRIQCYASASYRSDP